MHVGGGITVDLNWFVQFILTSFLIFFGLLHLVKNTASKYFEVDANFEGTDRNRHDLMSSSIPIENDDFSCVVCANPGTKKCSRCKSVRYCSSTCQSTHWKSGHKTKCKDYGKVNSVQSVITNFGPKASCGGGKNINGIALVPAQGTCKVFKKPRKVLFPYDEFVKLFNWNKPGFPPCGLLNCGNSCFANVVLQCLTYTRPLVAYLLEKGHRRECRHDDWCFLCELQAHVEKACQSQHPFSPMSILSRLPNIGGNLGYGRQEDAHEFMRFAIDTMQSICLDEFGGEKVVKPSSQETTLIQHIFGGHLQSQVLCTKCGNISNQYENMMDLTVEIHGDAASLEECLEQFTAKEWLHGENMYKCDGCNDYVKAWKRLTVRHAPNILTIALKRFQSGRFGKLNKRVSFHETLDLSPYMSEEGGGADVYKLYAVVVHVDMLNASFFGHYICYVKDFSGNWYKVDDCKVMNVEMEEVLSQGAYMLLYSRVAPRSSYLTNGEPSMKDEQKAVNGELEPIANVDESFSPSELSNPITRSASSSTDDASHLRVSVSSDENKSSSAQVAIEDLEDVNMVNNNLSSSDRKYLSSCNGKINMALSSKAAREDLQEDTHMVDSGPYLSGYREFSVCDDDSHVAIDHEAIIGDSEDINMVDCDTDSFVATDIKICGCMCSCPGETSPARAHNLKSLVGENGNGVKRSEISEAN
ncbi:ubiquitin carboxyl-terminal hydrolase 18-like [Mangifera indica]|uniref:ubiquitin carboxyl-terminal hydrolase 18-like n=1 Tax=Mangifera indica TaxID=29780 RepID=UPI001CFB4DDA|nr:ubiquitin carboxyl-terminal hydrolase 18-like [Mangifera indica]